MLEKIDRQVQIQGVAILPALLEKIKVNGWVDGLATQLFHLFILHYFLPSVRETEKGPLKISPYVHSVSKLFVRWAR